MKKKLFYIALLFLSLPGFAQAIVCTQATVQSAINSATPGDTISIDAGSCSWSGLSIAKPVTLQGAGIGSTNITLTGNNTITKQAGGKIVIDGFSFSKSGGGNSSKGWTIDGSWSAEPVIISNSRHDISVTGLYKLEVIGGVIFSDCSFYGLWDDSFIQPKLTGDTESWTTNSTMGTDDTDGKQNIYVEGCYFYGGTNQGVDADDAARIVFRYNTLDYSSFNSHGLGTSQTGVRHWEVYNNRFYNDTAGGWTGSSDIDDISNQNWAIWIRGGTGVITGNVIDDIANSYWGYAKAEVKFDIRAQQDNSGAAYGTTSPPVAKYSSGQGNYPRERQLGQSWNEALSNSYGIDGGNGDYITDPIYIWSNSGDGTTDGVPNDIGEGSWGDQTGYFNEDRDYYLGTAKSGWTASTCPNPNVGTGTCSGTGSTAYEVTGEPAAVPANAIQGVTIN